MKLPTLTPRRKAVVLAIAASVFTAGEAVVTSGIELPGSNDIPPWLRLLGIVVVTGGAFYFRWRAGRDDEGNSDGR